MELKNLSPDQKWIYKNIWPHPGSRFGNEWAKKLRIEKLRWLNRTFAQCTGFSPPAVSISWRETSPQIRDIADRIEYRNRIKGIDKKFLPTDFIDLLDKPTSEPDTDTDTIGMFGNLQEPKNKLEKYLVIALFIIAIILILKIIL